MTDAVGIHLGYYIAEMEHRAKRKLNKSMVAVEVFVALVGGGAMWLSGWLGGSVRWLFWVAFGVAAVVMFLFLAAGAAQLYADPKRDEAPQGALPSEAP